MTWIAIDENTPRDGRPLWVLDPALGPCVAQNSSSAPIAWAANYDAYLGYPDDEEWRLVDEPERQVRPTMWSPRSV